MRGPRRGARANGLSGHGRRALLAMLACLAALALGGVLSATAEAQACTGTTDNYIAGGGDWSVAGNWSMGIPSGSEVACWDAGDTVTVSDAESVDSIQTDGNLDITSTGTLLISSTLADPSSVANLELDGSGTLDGGPQSLAISGNFDWGGGFTGPATLNGLTVTAGTLMTDSTSTPTFAGGSLTVASAVSLSSTFVVSGTPTLTTSTGAITVNSDITGSGATFSAAGGVVDGTGTTYGFGTNTLDLEGGTTEVASGTALDSGPLTIAGGNLRVDSGGTVAPSSTTSIQGGVLQDDGIVSSPVSLSGGTLDGTGAVDGSVTNGSGTVTPGDAGAPGTLSVTGDYTQDSGASLDIVINGTAAGNFSQLSTNGAANLAGTLALSGSYAPMQGDSFEVMTYGSLASGAFTVTGGASYIETYNSTNLTLTVFNRPANCPAPDDVFFPTTGSSGEWSSGGTWLPSTPGSGDVACWATGTTVTLSGGDIQTVASIQGGSLDIDGGGLTLDSSTDGSDLSGSSSPPVDALSLTDGGTLNGLGQTLTVSGTFAWGASSGATTDLDVGGDDALKISMGAGTTFTFGGEAAAWGGGSISTGSALTLPVSFSTSGSPTLTTSSTITASSNIGGSGASFTAAGVDAGTTGSYGFGTSSLTLTGGTTTVASGNTLDCGALSITGGTLQDDGIVDATSTTVSGGTLDGTGTVDGPVTNASGGTVSPGDTGAGLLTVTGAYTQDSGASLDVAINSTTSYGQLSVGDLATLGGTLALSGTFTPANANAFEVVIYGSHTGTFTITGGSSYIATYNSTNLTLTYFVAPMGCPTGSDVFTPTTGKSGEWNSGGTWLPAVPTSTSIACWATGTTVTLGSGDTQTVAEINGGSLEIDGGGLTLDSATDPSVLAPSNVPPVAALSLTAAGTLTGQGQTLTLTGGDFDWGAATGTATLLDDLKIAQTGGNLVLGAEPATWEGGSISTIDATIGGTTLTETGAPALTATGGVTFTGATLPTSVTPGTITAAGITNTGTSSVLGASLHVEAGTNSLAGTLTAESLTADAGTTLTVTSPAALTAYAGTISGAITGTGTFTAGVLSGTGATTVPSGGSISTTALDVVGGTLTADSGGSLSAAGVDVNAGTLAVDSGATYAAATGTTIGTGVLDLADASSTTGALSLTGTGQLNGTSGTALSVAGAFTWSAGTINSPAGDALAITTGAGDTFSGTVALDAGSLTTASPVTITNTTIGGSTGTFSVGGVLAGAGAPSTYGFGTHALTLTGGTTSVASGQTLASGALSITGGTLGGTGTVNAAVANNSGTVSPGNGSGLGVLTITGAYSQGGSGTLAIELNGTTAGTDFGQLHAEGTTTLGGNVSLTDGSNFIPEPGDTFLIISTPSPSGVLTLTGPGAASYTAVNGSTGVTLDVKPTPGNTSAPAIAESSLGLGQTLTCSSGNWSAHPTSFAYQWNRDGSPISGATSNTYVITTDDQGHSLTCTVTATNGLGTGPAATSSAVSVPAALPPPGAPVNTAAPGVSGTPTPGNMLSCSQGTWSGGTTGFAYQWNRNGSSISGATGSTYKVQIADEGSSLTCTVTASNATGPGAPDTSGPIVVAEPGTLSCPKPTGRLSGSSLGKLALGLTQARARHTLTHRQASTGSGVDNFCLYGGWGIRAGYPSSKLLRSLSRKERARVKGRIVLALTGNPYYALDGATPGTKLTAAITKKLRVGKVIAIGLNDWYIAPGKVSQGVLRVRGGIIQEVGIANKTLTNGRAAQKRFLTGFNSS